MDAAAHRPTDDSADQIDVSSYVAVVARRWKLVLAATVLAVLAAAAATAVLARVAPRYTSEATVLLTGARYKLTLDPKFTTVDNAQAAALATRADEYRAIALSPDVHAAAAERYAAPGPAAVDGATIDV